MKKIFSRIAISYICILCFFIGYFFPFRSDKTIDIVKLGREDIKIVEFFEYCGKEILIFERKNTGRKYLCVMNGDSVDLIDVTD